MLLQLSPHISNSHAPVSVDSRALPCRLPSNGVATSQNNSRALSLLSSTDMRPTSLQRTMLQHVRTIPAPFPFLTPTSLQRCCNTVPITEQLPRPFPSLVPTCALLSLPRLPSNDVATPPAPFPFSSAPTVVATSRDPFRSLRRLPANGVATSHLPISLQYPRKPLPAPLPLPAPTSL